jgi:hypothetical protein
VARNRESPPGLVGAVQEMEQEGRSGIEIRRELATVRK